MDIQTNTSLARVKAYLNSPNPEVRALVKKASEDILNCKLLSPGNVHNDATLSNLSVQYQNAGFIGTRLMPVVQVSAVGGHYFKYGQADRRHVPNDLVGARSKPNEISETRSTATYACLPYALMNYIDDRTLRAADAPLNEMVDLIASVNDVMDLAEEIRIAAILTAAGSFPTGNKVTLAAADQWDSAGGGDPVNVILTGIDAIEMGGPNTSLLGYCDHNVWRVLSKHPAILDLFKNVTAGLATTQMVASFFGLDDILVGKARTNTSNEGQAAAKGRVWSDVFGILRVAQSPGIRTASFGYTLRFGQKQTSVWFDQGVGVSGGYYGRVGMDEDHEVVASDCGYLISDCLS